MATSKKEKPFETIVERLEEITKGLESGETTLEESLALFEEGVGLVKMGTVRLEGAEKKVEILMNQNTIEDFKPND